MDTAEFLSLSIDDIELILKDQRDLYSDDELAFLEKRLAELYSENERAYKEQKKLTLEARRKHIPTIVCPMCDGENPSTNQVCQYCSYEFKEKDYFRQPNDGTDTSAAQDSDGGSKGLYVIAFLLPIVGIIMGLIYIGKNEDELGKSLIIFSILVPIVVGIIVWILYAVLESDLSRIIWFFPELVGKGEKE